MGGRKLMGPEAGGGGEGGEGGVARGCGWWRRCGQDF